MLSSRRAVSLCKGGRPPSARLQSERAFFCIDGWVPQVADIAAALQLCRPAWFEDDPAVEGIGTGPLRVAQHGWALMNGAI
jgi:hypothetical protein